jgi:pSer/pThr/pTyr-binding forkhead associated (FHA) protein
MQAVLVMFRSDGERRSFSIARDITVIGRREDCDLRIPLGDISRKHCRLIRDGESMRLEDLGSSNGTFHNGQRVQEATLTPGDSVQVGPVVFVLQVDGVPADDELAPVIAAPVTEEGQAAEVQEGAAAEGEPYPAEAEGTVGPGTMDEMPSEEELEHLGEIRADAEEEDDGFNAVLDELSNNQKSRRH